MLDCGEAPISSGPVHYTVSRGDFCGFTADMASGSRLNHSMALRAAAWMLAFSILAMKSRTLPPCLHSLKQFQMFLLMLIRNCVGLLPLWIGHGPLKLSLPRLNLSRMP